MNYRRSSFLGLGYSLLILLGLPGCQKPPSPDEDFGLVPDFTLTENVVLGGGRQAAWMRGALVDWAEAEQALSNLNGGTGSIEIRNDAGSVLGVVVPRVSTRADDPDWVKAITPEEIERRMAEPFLTLEEYRKREGQ